MHQRSHAFFFQLAMTASVTTNYAFRFTTCFDHCFLSSHSGTLQFVSPTAALFTRDECFTHVLGFGLLQANIYLGPAGDGPKRAGTSQWIK
ncbi:protein of unknown function [Serratia sp. Tan611]|nr:protein of unknown function [Serratia sp. Tan611]